MLFRKRKISTPSDDLFTTINGTKIKFQNSNKYIGYHFKPNLKHNDQVDHSLTKATVALRTLYPILKVKNGICPKVKTKVYMAIIRPALIYGIPANGQRGMIQVIVDACVLNDYTKYNGACEMQRESTNSPIIKNEDTSSAEHTNNEAFTINVEDDDEDVETIFNSLFQWMRGMPEFEEIEYKELDFRVLQKYNSGTYTSEYYITCFQIASKGNFIAS
ncbi:hypothetical protein Bhyg_12728 [Pseudolycoriella hygida]|uniref:Uncharacterized protein n=1 Tax=Pseudolycoriella hygida TaxID=35572 RepID=A0A9Q0MZE4_9DIPT|nr:hypothetical protein Bhyg_12728 [Pseudolycoriella hygida]